MTDPKLLIIVQDRGFVLIALVVPHEQDYTQWRAVKKAVVRVWGTTAGLGELAEKGPHKATILDDEGAGDISKLHTFRTIECNKKAWQKWINS
jgi:hypothetical protein